VPGTIQPDGIHPTAKGAEIIARTLMAELVHCPLTTVHCPLSTVR